MKVNAVTYHKQLGPGNNLPQLISCDDGHAYAVKLMANPSGRRVLVNELIAVRLGGLLQLPVAQGRIVHVSEAFVASVPAVIRPLFHPGPHFGSLYDNTAEMFSPDLLPRCSNVGQAADIIVFDYWICNPDRHFNPHNLLIRVSEKENRLLLIDHEEFFHGPNWSMDHYHRNCRQHEAWWGRIYQAFVPYIDGEEPFREAVERLHSIERRQLQEAVDGVPDEWQLTADEREFLVGRLDERRAYVHVLLGQIVNNFPLWSKNHA